MKINANAIADGLEACRCVDLEQALDRAGEAIADWAQELAVADAEITRLGNELELARGVADAIAECLRETVAERDGLRLERDAAHAEVADLHRRFGVVA